MAQKRMFSKNITETDAFLDMPKSTQCLYFHLNMNADDDGFVSSPKKVMRIIGASDDDMNILISKRFIIPFDSQICVIKHWLIHNTIRKDRYTETNYLEEKSMLHTKDNKSYTLGIPNGNLMETQIRLGLDKNRLDKNSKDKELQEAIMYVIDYFNNKIGNGKYRHDTEQTQKDLKKIFKKYKIEDITKVIDLKYKQWFNDKNMKNHFKPKTIFRYSNFESYLDEAETYKEISINKYFVSDNEINKMMEGLDFND